MEKSKMLLALAVMLVAVQIVAAQVATREQAAHAIEEAELTINSMRDAGFGTVFVTDTLNQAKDTFGQGEIADYDQVIQLTARIEEISGRAFSVGDSLKALNISIAELEGLSLNATRPEEIYSQAADAFYNERYDEAEALIEDGFRAASEAQAEYSRLSTILGSTQQNLVAFVGRNLREILAASAAAAAIIVVGGLKLSSYRRKRKLTRLELEKAVLLNLIKKAQSDRFEKGLITKREYEIKTEKFKEMLVDSERAISVLKGGKSGAGKKAAQQENIQKPGKPAEDRE
ncbi:MAG: hypothetical protein HY367_00820 [Candidatus Aenigmarchaeota archaeon]|nr:hypothetical protein [Candidatus Aenigmarchaeota archaeon]